MKKKCTTTRGTNRAKHKTKRRANKARDRMLQKQNLILNVYFCERCKNWHLGTPNKKYQLGK